MDKKDTITSDILSNYETGGMGISIWDNKPAIQVYIKDKGYTNAVSDTALEGGKTYLISGTYDGSNIKIYVNGELKKSTAVVGTIKNPDNNTVMAIGCASSGSTAGAPFAQMNLYSARIYDRALTQEEILQNYEMDKKRFVKTNEYVTGGLLRHFDAINNTGVGHLNSTNIWKDLSGNYNGTINNGAVISENYVNFDGTDDWVNVGQITGKSAITLEATVMLNSVPSVNSRIWCNQENGGTDLYINNGGFGFEVYINNSYQGVGKSINLNLNQKYHMLGTYDGKIMKIYLNGQLISSKEVQGTTIKDPDYNTVMAIGTNPSGNSGYDSYANIKVYSARIYDRALTDAEVLQNYKMDKERFGINQ